ncbi:hypothetical protein F5Y06DRAFT_151585 [Hypoxylon sp. FL0890]|nr:hypothetical protein F5Y06DRAFT_151585 [Hypoxylon sp. FL0890]
MSHETVGSLLAVIANSLNDGLRILMFADKRAWGSDEFEQLRLLEETLDEAKKDFQELPALVNGRFYYENDRISESLEDLRDLCTRFELHAQTFKDWVRQGGPIDPKLAHETITLKRDLHRAQCRAARRIHAAQQVDSTTASARCLGALQVYRVQQRPNVSVDEERLVCAQTGRFERFCEHDVAFVCDFCDGFLVWEDLRAVPTMRLQQHQPRPTQDTNSDGNTNTNEPRSATNTTFPPSAKASSGSGEGTTASTNWQARGITMTTGEAKTIVFAPVGIANHLPPELGDFRCRVLCPQCDEYYYEEQGEDDMERVRYVQDARGFDDVRALQEHLEWSHASIVPSTSSCQIM